MEKKGAGGVVILKEKELKILLIKDKYGFWTWPKGHMEKGETPKQTAKREIFEETGQKSLGILELLGKQEYSFFIDKEKIKKTVYIFLIKVIEKQEIKVQYSEIQDARWFTVKEALNKIGYNKGTFFIEKAVKRFEQIV